MRPYHSYVTAQSERNPSIANLCRFLADPTAHRTACRIASLDFIAGHDAPTHQYLDARRLQPAVQDWHGTSQEVLGRILIVEDLTRDVVEVLGSCLDIDPLFFASHIHAAYNEIATQTPELAALPSRARPDKFINIHYHRTLVVQKTSALPRKLLRNTNVDRKVVIMPPTSDMHTCLVQHCCSVFKSRQKGKSWLCMSP
jgi:hypothetical protein